MQYYCTYVVDGKGNVTKETRYDKNNALIGYTTNSYYEYGGQSFLRKTLEYNSEDRIQSGASYVRSGYELKEKDYLYDKSCSHRTYKVCVKGFSGG